MGKHLKRSYELKKKIVEELLQGMSYTAVSKKYDIRSGTIANWKKKYLNGTLAIDKRGRKQQEIEDIEILKKSYALLKEIRSKQPE
ncbi:transposase-like protein [Breznakia sp. PF5-3]|uniref:helix-turn-helix domain-containing protein n=1 Tax=unclassified Breznakia TaxID=2623764 RepID=UPI0024058119|nr:MULTISPECIES: helix-turn-helix domain-containing protein [unclassified Breznakia]MDF9825263.1 transposase-like protein [Breznakia sp. PM6-1]MDF9836147.1 transposase-like protein [Breznakia sp. PF5-3]MDF9838166.1 transposase-like protein [Breznakia sp. PFB2-8]MDF9860152.1 transposase-like protein [Breznakia sp. PH5-24]